MIELSQKNFVQEILKAFHKRIKEYFGEVKISFNLKRFPAEVYTLNFNDIVVNIVPKKIKGGEDSLFGVELTAPRKYQIAINPSVFDKNRLPEIVRIGYEQGLRTGELLTILRYFAEASVLTVIARIKSNYSLIEEKYNANLRKLTSELGDSPFFRDRIKKLVNLLKLLGSPDFQDFSDVESVRLGLIEGMVLKELDPKIIGDVDSLRRILKQWSESVKQSEEADMNQQAYYMIYDFQSLVLEDELAKAVSRVAGRVMLESELKELILHPSLVKLYNAVLKEHPPIKSSYSKMRSQLTQEQIRKLLRELRFIKIQERKYNRLILINGIANRLVEDEEVKYYINRLISFNRLKYDELVGKTVEYALVRKIASNITI